MSQSIDFSSFQEVTEIKDIQKLLYELMKKFHEICEEYKLYYVVFGGTMLGAVRHQGMIPWDDDIDVFIADAYPLSGGGGIRGKATLC